MPQARQPVRRLPCIIAIKMNIVLFYIVCVTIGLFVDWALYERFTLYVEAVKKVEAKRSYKDLLFPRILISIIGLSSIALDPYSSIDHRMLLWVGLTLFLVSIAYLLIMAYRPRSNNSS